LALLALAVPLSLAPAAAPPISKDEPLPTRFTRIKRDRSGKPLALQKAIVRYAPREAGKGNEGLTVDLVSVVHVGDREFYQALNKRFKAYDVVLYEGVKGAPKNKLLLLVAGALSRLLDYDSVAKDMALDAQHKYVDYEAANFVHADVTWDDWADRVSKRGYTRTSLTLKLAADLTRSKKQAGPSVSSSRDPIARKVSLAEYFDKTQGSSDLSETMEMLLLDVRNDACMDVLKGQIAAGKKRIAIFYGSAHNPDFERRLMQQFGMRRQSVEYVDAWDLTGGERRRRDATKRE